MQRQAGIVTGAARGLGRAVAGELARRGAAIVAVDPGVSMEGLDPDARPLEQACDEIRREGGSMEALAADVGRGDAVRRAFAIAGERFGPVSGIVHAAGIMPVASIRKTSAAVFDRTMHVHLRGAFLLCREALRRLRNATVVLVTSGAGLDGAYPGLAAYSMAKAGMTALLRVAAEEGRSRNLAFIGIAPIVRSRMSGGRAPEASILDAARAAVAVAALLDPRASFLSGSVIRAQSQGLSLWSAPETEWAPLAGWSDEEVLATLERLRGR